ncbi:hypothetical protein TNCV_903061 [Trichonephila clavipes]|nr:hypothetical protein TNCV_903061 [Trichonephila clavipes]
MLFSAIRSPSTFEMDNLEDPDVPIGIYHTSALYVLIKIQRLSLYLLFVKEEVLERLFLALCKGGVRARGGYCNKLHL